MPQDEFAFQRNLAGEFAVKQFPKYFNELGCSKSPLPDYPNSFEANETEQLKPLKMKKYLGVKIIQAEPLSEFDFGRSKGMTPSDSEVDREGYKVVYEDGYVSWSPKDVFEKAYRSFEETGETSEERLGIMVDRKTGEWGFGGRIGTPVNNEDLKRFCVDQGARIAAYKGGDALDVAKEIFKWITE